MTERENLFTVIRSFRTAMLVSQAAGGTVHVRPMAVAEIEDDGDIIFATSLDSPKLSEIKSNPNVSVTLQNGGQFAEAKGRAAVVRDQVMIDRLWSETWRVWFPEGKADPSLCLIKVEAEAGEYWDNRGFKGLKYIFQGAKAIALGTPPESDASQHAKVNL